MRYFLLFITEYIFVGMVGKSLVKQAKKINFEELCRKTGTRGQIQIKLDKRITHSFKSPMGICVTEKYLIVGDTMNCLVKVNIRPGLMLRHSRKI